MVDPNIGKDRIIDPNKGKDLIDMGKLSFGRLTNDEKLFWLYDRIISSREELKDELMELIRSVDSQVDTIQEKVNTIDAIQEKVNTIEALSHVI